MSKGTYEVYISSVIKEYGSEYFDSSEIDKTPHDFSQEFEHKMSDLMTAKRKQHKRRILITLIAAAAIIAVMGASIGAVGEIFRRFKVVEYEDHAEIALNDDAFSSGHGIETKYNISEIPDGYRLTSVDDGESMRTIVYSNGDNSDSPMIMLMQADNSLGLSVDTEGSGPEYVEINGYEGIYTERHEYCSFMLTWEMDGNVFTVLCRNDESMNRDRLINIAGSVSIER